MNGEVIKTCFSEGVDQLPEATGKENFAQAQTQPPIITRKSAIAAILAFKAKPLQLVGHFIPKWNAFLWPIWAILLLGTAHGQLLSNNILNTANASDWTKAGVQGGIPSGSWTQCGTTIAAYTGSAATINSAIAACGSNQFVLLGSGTFTLSTGIDFAHKSNVVLRGAGGNSTFLVFSGTSSVSCDGEGTLICLAASDSTYWGSNTSYSWTAGYSQGGTTVTLSSTSGISTGTILVLNQCDTGFSGATCATGNSTDNGNYFNCGQQYSASGPHGCSQSGPNAGNGSTLRFQTEIHTVTNVNSGTGVVTLGEPLVNPNWASGQTPQAWFITPLQNDGVENLSLNSTGNTTALTQVMAFNTLNVWVSGVVFKNGDIASLAFFDSVHYTDQNNYFYSNIAADSHAIRFIVTSFGLTQNNIIQQNVGPILAEGDDEGSVIAYNAVFGNCNYQSSAPANCASDTQDDSFRVHSNGNTFTLYEGNYGIDYDADGNHGTALSQTLFRNFFVGWESCGVSNSQSGTVNVAGTAVTWVSGATFTTGTSWNQRGIAINTSSNPTNFVIASVTDSTHLTLTTTPPGVPLTGVGYGVGQCGFVNQKDFHTWAVTLAGLQGRYHYIVGNVLGTPGYHNVGYQWTTTLDNHTIYANGIQVGGSTPSDTIVGTTLTRWANYDVFTGAVRTCASGQTGFSSTCGSVSEIPTGLSVFPNSIPTLGDTVAGQSVMPPSFYLASKPSWFGSIPWPPIGPDVTSGNIGQCSGSLNTSGQFNGVATLSNAQCGSHGFTSSAWAGHVNATPAMACFLNTMGGPPDGSGSILPFDANTCYGASPSAATPTFSPVAGTYSSTQSVTPSTTSGTVICYNFTGAPATNGTTGCTTGTLYTTPISVSVSETLFAVAGGTGLLDSSVGSAAYVLQGSAPTFNPIGGPYVGTQTLSLSQAQSLSMCYTTNGTTPASTAGSCTTGTLYSGPILVSVSETVKAIGFQNGWTDSSVGSASYTITQPTSGATANYGAILTGGAVLK